MAIVFPEGTQNYRNRILQTTFNSANNNVLNNSDNFAESRCNVSITPLESNSTIIIEVNCMQWISGNVYHKQQLRCSGGATNNNIGTYADVYGTGTSYAAIGYTHILHTILLQPLLIKFGLQEVIFLIIVMVVIYLGLWKQRSMQHDY